MKYQAAVLQYRQKDVNAPSSDWSELIVVSPESKEVLATLANKLAYDGIYLLGDKLRVYKKSRGDLILNLSCQVLHTARFRRNLNSVMRNLANKSHPLNRVLVTNKKNAYWVIPYDIALRHQYFSSMSSDETIKSGGDDV